MALRSPTTPLDSFREENSRSPGEWKGATYLAIASLVMLWAVKFYSTWCAWGNLTIDSGHEMYIPALLSRGRVLYRDVWFMYGPASPYFNSLLFRLFGERLTVLYWAGSLSAVGSAIFLYLAGARLSYRLLGWTAGAVILLEAFQPSLYCFPLPYSFAAVYGCLVGCLFLWLMICAAQSGSWGWLLGAASAAALALELKPEFGLASYASFGLLILALSVAERSWKPILRGMAVSIPGIIACAWTIAWMVSLRGAEFITQENIVSWPTTFFMKRYGKLWLERNGFTLSPDALYDAALRAIPMLGAAAIVYSFLYWRRSDWRSYSLRTILILVFLLNFAAKSYLPYTVREFSEIALTPLFFPLDMVLYVAIAAAGAWWVWWRRGDSRRDTAVPLLMSFASLLAFRILMGMRAEEYPIYYNGPVVLSFLVMLCWLIPRTGRSARFVLAGQSLICLGCLIVVLGSVGVSESLARYYVPLPTERGTVRAPANLVKNYEAAISFMKERAAQGESVLSIPEDTSLYFLSGTVCPTRTFDYTPGVIAPGKMEQETIRQIDEKRVRYLIWSNRVFPEFGTPVFGQDFNREIGDYLRSHYRRQRRLLPDTTRMWEWTATIWERIPDEQMK